MEDLIPEQEEALVNSPNPEVPKTIQFDCRFVPVNIFNALMAYIDSRPRGEVKELAAQLDQSPLGKATATVAHEPAKP